MRLFIHALGASAGGGLTYLRNVIPHLAERGDTEITLLAGEYRACRPSIVQQRSTAGQRRGPSGCALSRFIWEQKEIPELIRKMGADVLVSAGNFAVLEFTGTADSSEPQLPLYFGRV